MNTEIKFERSPNSEFVLLTPITVNHNNGRLKREILGLTMHNPVTHSTNLTKRKSLMDSPCYRLL